MEWPLHIRIINYRWDSDGVHTAYVQLVGSLWGWLMAGIALVATVGLLVLQWWRPCPSSNRERRALMVMLLLQYLVFMTAHAYLVTMRVMYLYHYFLALVLCLLPSAPRFSRGRGKMASTTRVAGIGAGGNYSVVTGQFRVLFAVVL